MAISLFGLAKRSVCLLNDDVMIRKATIQDVKAIHKLLQLYGLRGVLLARPLSELYDHVRDFFVYVDHGENRVVGCCALQFCWEDLAEIRSLAVQPEYKGRGIGHALVKTVISEAESFKTRKIFTLTYEPAFFKNFGFKEIDRAKLPLKIWADCIICVKFPDCDETAMMKDLGLNRE
jgi:amino-acid N-acetyltransferase